MSRAIEVLHSGQPRGQAIDTLILDSAQRRLQRGLVTGEKGTSITFDFAQPVALRTDDVLLLETGETVEVVAAAERLLEVRGDIPTLSKVAHALGDRHLPVQIMTNRIRLHRGGDGQTSAISALIVSLGGKVANIEAPFEPEGGAYAVAHSAHDHAGHDHAGHDHAGHTHGHDHCDDPSHDHGHAHGGTHGHHHNKT